MTNTEGLLLELFKFCAVSYALHVGKYLNLNVVQELYSSITEMLSKEGVRIITPLAKYDLMSLGALFVNDVIGRFLRYLDGELSTLGYWRNRLVELESDAQLIGLLNEFIELLGKNAGQMVVAELVAVMGEVLGIGGKKSRNTGVGSRLEFCDGKVRNADVERTNFSGGAYR